MARPYTLPNNLTKISTPHPPPCMNILETDGCDHGSDCQDLSATVQASKTGRLVGGHCNLGRLLEAKRKTVFLLTTRFLICHVPRLFGVWPEVTGHPPQGQSCPFCSEVCALAMPLAPGPRTGLRQFRLKTSRVRIGLVSNSLLDRAA